MELRTCCGNMCLLYSNELQVLFVVFNHLIHGMFCFQTAYTIPILAFAFVCHPEVLPIYTELRE